MGKRNLVLYQQKDIFSREEKVLRKLNKIGTDFYITKSYFLYDKTGFIDQTFITALNKKNLFMVLLVTSPKELKMTLLK